MAGKPITTEPLIREKSNPYHTPWCTTQYIKVQSRLVAAIISRWEAGGWSWQSRHAACSPPPSARFTHCPTWPAGKRSALSNISRCTLMSTNMLLLSVHCYTLLCTVFKHRSSVKCRDVLQCLGRSSLADLSAALGRTRSSDSVRQMAPTAPSSFLPFSPRTIANGNYTYRWSHWSRRACLTNKWNLVSIWPRGWELQLS